jgi:hypothetical protein
MLRRATFMLLGCVLLVVSTASWATIVRPFTLRGLATEAHEVVRGEVVDQEVLYDAWWDRVYTHTTVRVAEAIGGDVRPGDLIVVRQLGGELDGLETILIGTADFTLGDDVVLFTRTDGALHYLVGMAQGSYFVVAAEDGRETVTRSLGALGMPPLPQPAGRLAPNRTTLDDLRVFVANVREQGGTP